jgi:hypothetical protein
MWVGYKMFVFNVVHLGSTNNGMRWSENTRSGKVYGEIKCLIFKTSNLFAFPLTEIYFMWPNSSILSNGKAE